MEKARVSLTIDVPLAGDEFYPEGTTGPEKAKYELTAILIDPAWYFENVVDSGRAWVSGAHATYVDDKVVGQDG